MVKKYCSTEMAGLQAKRKMILLMVCSNLFAANVGDILNKHLNTRYTLNGKESMNIVHLGKLFETHIEVAYLNFCLLGL